MICLLVGVFAACNDEKAPNTDDKGSHDVPPPGDDKQEEEEEDMTPSGEGVVYDLSDDGTYAVVKKYSGEGGYIEIADTYEGLPVKEICFEAFKYQDVTKVFIPKSVTCISGCAFWYCSDLKSVIFEEGFSAEIDSDVFYGCNKLAKTEYDGCAYLGCGENPYFLLYECKSTGGEMYEIHAETRIIAGNAFSRCDDLAALTIPASVEVISNGAFNGCEALASVSFEANSQLKVLGDYAFSDCALLESILLPEGLLSIGEWTFSATALSSLTIPASVTCVKSSAVSDCSNLQSITVAQGNTTYHSAGNCLIETKRGILVAGCKTSVIPDDGSVTKIAGEAFYRCTELSAITIPDSVTQIEAYAFDHCTSLTSVIFAVTQGWEAGYASSFFTALDATALGDAQTAAAYLTDEHYSRVPWIRT